MKSSEVITHGNGPIDSLRVLVVAVPSSTRVEAVA